MITSRERAVWELFHAWEEAERGLFSETGVGQAEEDELERQIKERRALIERLFGPAPGKRYFVVGRMLGDIDGYVAGQVRGGRRSAIPIVTTADPARSGWRGYRPVAGDELVVLAGAIDGECYSPCIRMLQIMDRDGVFSEQLTLLADRLPGVSE